MLDLKSLEEKLDHALESETPDSLRSWLISKRSRNLREFLKQPPIRDEISNPSLFSSNGKKGDFSSKTLSQYLNSEAPQAVEDCLEEVEAVEVPGKLQSEISSAA